ncbi:MAG: 2-oxoacid:acceptor oxidoreductase family protein [Chloroflexota bacterium]|jgi:2-oxoglutarate ferredoxin oxidoreductase subunit gamma|nr:2-oxoacid:acceptor oxidoreductase family protein [Chloroflexota bacterium]
MQQEVIIAGFGGQGVLFAGQLLAYTAMDEGREVTWIPSYGPEMRGGTANCTVVVADEEIGSPFVKNPTAVIAMNLPSLDKYEDLVAEGGVLVVNASMVNREVKRDDIKVVSIPANEIALELGSERSMNMIMLGALLANLDLLSLDAVEKALEAHMPKRHQKFLPANKAALRKGAEYKVVEPEKA